MSNSCGTPTQYQIPVNDSSCAVPTSGDNKEKYSNLLEECCGSAPVQAYDNDCASYCLAVDQTVKELTDCLYNDGKGVKWEEVWCVGKGNDTATGKPEGTATKTSGGDSASETESATGTDSAAAETSTGAASSLRAAKVGGEGWLGGMGASSAVVLGLAAFWGLGVVVAGVTV